VLITEKQAFSPPSAGESSLFTGNKKVGTVKSGEVMRKKLYSYHTKIDIFRAYRLLLIPLTLVLFFTNTLSAEPVNLSKGEVFVRKGFDISWTKTIPEGGKWKKLESPEKMKSFRIKELGLEGVPKRKKFSFKTFKEEDFTLIFAFNIHTEIPDFPGIYIQDIGIKWEVYINGKAVIQNYQKKGKSSIRRDQSHRKILAYINPLYLKKGKNITAFRICGDPALPLTGIFRNRIVIDDYEKLSSEKSEVTTLILIFIYLTFGFYNLFLYVNSRKEAHYLFFSLISLSYFLYILAQTRSIYTLFSSPYFLKKFEFVVLYTLIPFFGFFIEEIIFRKIKKFTKIYSYFSIFLIILTLFTPLVFAYDLLKIWQITALVPILYFAFIDIGLTFFNRINVKYAGIQGKKRFSIFIWTVTKALGTTVEGNLIIGFFVIAGCSIFDIIDSIFFYHGIMASRYGFFFFIIGIGMTLSNRFLFMMKEIESLNISLSHKIEDLNSANTAISLSEEKYRTLVEGSNDMIFSLDEDLMFINANKSLKNILDVDDHELRKKNFLDLIMDDNKGRSMSLEFIREKIDLLVEKKIPVQFTTNFRSQFKTESLEVHVRLEHINVEGKNEILGKATGTAEDSLIHYFVSEQQCFEIGNYLTIAEEISHRITKNLMKYIEQRSIDIIRIAVREIIVNAIEHGNLNISYEEKNKALEEGNFFKLFYQRQQDPSLRERKVKIEYRANSSRAEYIIEDEGSGFNYRAILDNSNQANVEMRSHGRGILMAKNVFDSIEYNKKGNQVLLIKNF
jgi:PAS domain S-box-containing protein